MSTRAESCTATVAIMQPYVFPYLGYFQLVAAVDTFCFLDDVAFIKKGFIHRNSVNRLGHPYRFALEVKAMSQNRAINAHEFIGNHTDFLKTLHHAYRRHDHFDETYALVQALLPAPGENVARAAQRCVEGVSRHLSLTTRFTIASEVDPASTATGEQRIIGLCTLQNAARYINPAGGRDLYTREAFAREGVQLQFLRMRDFSYATPRTSPYLPSLSIIDALMSIPVDGVRALLKEYVLE